MRKYRYTIWIETKNGGKNPVEINIKKEDIEPMIKKWNRSKKIFIEDVVLTERNQKLGIKTDEWGYIGIIETR